MRKTSIDHRVCELILVELDRQRISGSELARRIGMSQAAISRRLCGEVSFSLTELGDVAEVLGVPIEHLVAPPGQMRFSA